MGKGYRERERNAGRREVIYRNARTTEKKDLSQEQAQEW